MCIRDSFRLFPESEGVSGDVFEDVLGIGEVTRGAFVGIRDVYKRQAFYSVEKPRKITKQHLLKEYAGVPLEKRSVQLDF